MKKKERRPSVVIIRACIHIEFVFWQKSSMLVRALSKKKKKCSHAARRLCFHDNTILKHVTAV